MNDDDVNDKGNDNNDDDGHDDNEANKDNCNNNNDDDGGGDDDGDDNVIHNNNDDTNETSPPPPTTTDTTKIDVTEVIVNEESTVTPIITETTATVTDTVTVTPTATATETIAIASEQEKIVEGSVEHPLEESVEDRIDPMVASADATPLTRNDDEKEKEGATLSNHNDDEMKGEKVGDELEGGEMETTAVEKNQDVSSSKELKENIPGPTNDNKEGDLSGEMDNHDPVVDDVDEVDNQHVDDNQQVDVDVDVDVDEGDNRDTDNDVDGEGDTSWADRPMGLLKARDIQYDVDKQDHDLGQDNEEEEEDGDIEIDNDFLAKLQAGEESDEDV